MDTIRKVHEKMPFLPGRKEKCLPGVRKRSFDLQDTITGMNYLIQRERTSTVARNHLEKSLHRTRDSIMRQRNNLDRHLQSAPQKVAYCLSLLKLMLGMSGFIFLSFMGSLFEALSWDLSVGKNMSLVFYIFVIATGVIGLLGWRHNSNTMFLWYTVFSMIGLMVSIFAIIMILIYFASPSSNSREVGQGVGMMFGFLVASAIFAPSIIVGHKSKLLATTAPEYVQYLAVGSTENSTASHRSSNSTESSIPTKMEPPQKQIFFR